MRFLRRSLLRALNTVRVLAVAASAAFKSRAALQLENLALRHPLGVLQRSVKRPKLTPPDRALWVWLYAVWNDWQSALVIVKPDTVIAWHRKSFRLFWTWKVAYTGLADVDAELEKFAVDTRCATQRILVAQPADQFSDIFRGRRPPRLPAPNLPCPEQAEALAVPGDHGVRFGDDQSRLPVVPYRVQPYPQGAIWWRSGAWR